LRTSNVGSQTACTNVAAAPSARKVILLDNIL
jgi:hypothetical protein